MASKREGSVSSPPKCGSPYPLHPRKIIRFTSVYTTYTHSVLCVDCSAEGVEEMQDEGASQE